MGELKHKPMNIEGTGVGLFIDNNGDAFIDESCWKPLTDDFFIDKSEPTYMQVDYSDSFSASVDQIRDQLSQIYMAYLVESGIQQDVYIVQSWGGNICRVNTEDAALDSAVCSFAEKLYNDEREAARGMLYQFPGALASMLEAYIEGVPFHDIVVEDVR